MVLNSKPGWVRTKQSKVRYSSWLTESAKYGAEPDEPISNWSIRLIKNPKVGQKVFKRMRNQTKETVLNSEPGWGRTKQSKVRYSSWMIESANYGAETVFNWSIQLTKNPKFGQKVPNEWRSKKRKGCQFRARMSENQTKQGQVFLVTDKVSQLWCWTGWTGFQLVHPDD